MNGLLAGEDQKVTDWCFTTFNLCRYKVDGALGVITPEGKLIGAVLFHFYNGCNVEISYYGPRTVTLGIVKSIARVVLYTFNASRATMITSKRNKHLIKSLLKLGFKIEGVQRCHYGHADTNRNAGVRLVMFRSRIEEIAAERREGIA
jgi:RimJ/RimL family protein N-acetyltransferase